MPHSEGRTPLSDAEFQVLKILWAAGPSPAGQVRELINAEGRDWAYTTTKTVLDRLEEKGYARRSRATIPHVFAPAVSPDALAQARMKEVRRDLFGGATLPFVRALLDSVRLTPEDVDELRAELEDMEGAGGEEE